MQTHFLPHQATVLISILLLFSSRQKWPGCLLGSQVKGALGRKQLVSLLECWACRWDGRRGLLNHFLWPHRVRPHNNSFIPSTDRVQTTGTPCFSTRLLWLFILNCPTHSFSSSMPDYPPGIPVMPARRVLRSSCCVPE